MHESHPLARYRAVCPGLSCIQQLAMLSQGHLSQEQHMESSQNERKVSWRPKEGPGALFRYISLLSQQLSVSKHFPFGAVKPSRIHSLTLKTFLSLSRCLGNGTVLPATVLPARITNFLYILSEMLTLQFPKRGDSSAGSTARLPLCL